MLHEAARGVIGAAPFPGHEDEVRPEWIDRNGHMNLAYYLVVFDLGTDALFDALEIGAAYTDRSGNSIFVVETHTVYERELRLGERVGVVSQLLGVDAKRLHFVHEMLRRRDGKRAASLEVLALHVDFRARRAAPFPQDVRDRLAQAVAAQSGLVRPPGLGRRVGLPD